MARTKNREYQQVLSPAYTFSRRWKMGGYIRLSKEDLKKALNGKDDSNSVKNQRDLLNDFYRKYQEEFESITEYVDAAVIIGLKTLRLKKSQKHAAF